MAVAEVPPGPPVLQTLVAEIYGPTDTARVKLAEEVKKEEVEKMEEEFGDLLFSVINAARLYGIDPETALEKTNLKFMKRFSYLEKNTLKKGRKLKDMNLDEMNRIWEQAKDYD